MPQRTTDERIKAPSIIGRFEEALAWFLGRVLLTDAELDRLRRAARAQAFWIRGVADLRLLQDAFDAIARSQNLGLPFAEFKKRLAASLYQAWGSRQPHRVETIWINNLQRSYNGGRYRHHTRAAFKALRPFWLYDAVMDARTTDICQARDDVCRLADDPWWQANYPPLHHRCRSAVRALTRRQGERRGDTPIEDIESEAQEGWGLAPPPEPDENWRPDMGGLDAELAAHLEQQAALRE